MGGNESFADMHDLRETTESVATAGQEAPVFQGTITLAHLDPRGKRFAGRDPFGIDQIRRASVVFYWRLIREHFRYWEQHEVQAVAQEYMRIGKQAKEAIQKGAGLIRLGAGTGRDGITLEHLWDKKPPLTRSAADGRYPLGWALIRF